jgi:hypothetical protein
MTYLPTKSWFYFYFYIFLHLIRTCELLTTTKAVHVKCKMLLMYYNNELYVLSLIKKRIHRKAADLSDNTV